MDDVQRLEAERLQPTPAAYPLDDLFRDLLGQLAALWTTDPDGTP